MRLVIVEWIDSMGSNTWQDIAGEQSYVMPTLYSVGWVVAMNKERVTLGSSFAPHNNMAGQTMTIPRNCIKKVTPLAKHHSLATAKG